jgi:hypothetical protein
LTLKGVVVGGQSADQRKAIIVAAQQLAVEPGPLFEVAGRYPPSKISDALAHVRQAGRSGVVLFDFARSLEAGS